jgi:myo-inositol-1(or 4)-monophosphatase
LTPSSIKVKVAHVLELIVQEAGGLVTDFAGNRGYQESGNVLAGDPIIHAEMLRRIQPHLTEDLRR